MQQDLKNQHLMEEKKRIEARKARLSKLDLDLDPVDTPAPVKKSAHKLRQTPERFVRPAQINIQQPIKKSPFIHINEVGPVEKRSDPAQQPLEISVKKVKKRKIPVAKVVCRGAAIFFCWYMLFGVCALQLPKAPAKQQEIWLSSRHFKLVLPNGYPAYF